MVAADPDVICLQEIKAQKEQLDLTLFEKAGYPYHYWFSAQKKGYSGVAILCKTKPESVVYGTGIESIDFETENIMWGWEQEEYSEDHSKTGFPFEETQKPSTVVVFKNSSSFKLFPEKPETFRFKFLKSLSEE